MMRSKEKIGSGLLWNGPVHLISASFSPFNPLRNLALSSFPEDARKNRIENRFISAIHCMSKKNTPKKSHP
jgi:hypothetical protein